ncbi:MAG: hypothetical protein EGR90_00125 [Lachnospiraceae bacterium]|nr:hypothetical protein [Lachnospiraceae bacterium]
MAIKPILFNTEMVRAILDGRKSCTRRICKDANECTVPDMDFYNADMRTYAVHNFADKKHTEQLSIAERTCPICPGDILYVRETWCKNPNYDEYYFRTRESGIAPYGLKWHPSIHMPKEVARIWLKVTDVRVERLQDMDWRDALDEGVNTQFPRDKTGEYIFDENPIDDFIELWNSTIKKSDLDRYGWDASPYVWVIKFERCKKPEGVK